MDPSIECDHLNEDLGRPLKPIKSSEKEEKYNVSTVHSSDDVKATDNKNINSILTECSSSSIMTEPKNNAKKESIQKLRELLQQPKYKKVLKEDGSVSAPKSAVYSELSAAIGKVEPLSAKYIYTILKLNRYNMHDFILNFYNIHHEKPIPTDSISDDSQDGILRFTIDISEIWEHMEIEDVTYNSKNKTTLSTLTLKRNSWTSYLFEKIYENTNIQCPITFKHNRISGSGYALKVIGYCSECHSQFTGYIANEPEENQPILMDCEVENYDPSFIHEKKRPLNGYRRKEVAEELVEKKKFAITWRREETDRLMKSGDKEPPHLFRGATLKKAKQEHQNKLSGIEASDIYNSIHNMKYDLRFESAIRYIALDPFCVNYFTNEQIAVYQQYHESVLIDSNGSLVRRIELPNGELSPRIFLYQAVTRIKDSNYVPFCQMISAVQNINSISFWLSEFLRIGSTNELTLPVPKEVVTNFSKALLGAIARSFAKKNSLNEYLSYCFRLILGHELINPPCFIRLDVCHFMNIVARWECWKRNEKEVKHFFLRSIAVLRDQQSLNDIEKYAKAIFIASLNESQIDGDLTDQARIFLNNSFQETTVEDKYLEMADEDDNLHDDDSNYDDPNDTENEGTDTDIFEWAKDLFKKSEKIVVDQNVTGDINPYFCPEIANNLRELLPFFPLFSDVMVSKFKYGTKRPTFAAVKSEFNDTKNRILSDITSSRADEFLDRHIMSFSGKIKIGFANQDNGNEKSIIKTSADIHEIQCSTDKIQNNSDEDISELKGQENLRGKKTLRKRIKNVDRMPDFEVTQKAITKLPTILNGSLTENIRFGNKRIVLSNTCAFDSICQILAMAIQNHRKYEESIQEMNIPILKIASKLVREGLKNNVFYTERAKLLYNLSIFDEKKGRRGIVEIDANINIGRLTCSLFSDAPTCIICKKCSKCNKSVRSRNYSSIPANIEILKNGFNNLKEAIIDAFDTGKKCCGTIMAQNINYGPHILVETDLGEGYPTVLKTIPQILQLTERKNYQLVGIVAYTGNFQVNSIGHYTSYIPTGNLWLHYDDTSEKSASQYTKTETQIYAHLCVYVLK